MSVINCKLKCLIYFWYLTCLLGLDLIKINQFLWYNIILESHIISCKQIM